MIDARQALKWIGAFVIAIAALTSRPAQAQTAWTNGRWFDGARFVERTLYTTADGRLSTRRPRRLAETVDLQGAYVVPAYGDAHHHGIDGEAGLDQKIAAFLQEGVFYVKNPNAIPDLLTPAVRAKINRPDSIDVVFANGGLTGSGAHPGPLHDHLASAGVFPGLTAAEMPGRAYHVVDTAADLQKAWPRILAGRPDFIKVFLNGRERLARGAEAGTRVGLAPEVLEAVVKRARAAGLRVTAHVDTAQDADMAVRAGVDEFGHLPAYDPFGQAGPEAYLISEQTAVEAARRGVVVVPTAGVFERVARRRLSAEQRAASLHVQRRNIALLRKHGVALAAGSDGISGERPMVTARDEIAYLRDNKLADGLQLLRMWAVTTPKTIFPGRRIGELRDGYEANFLVLGGDPIADPEALHRIRLRVKAGRLLPSGGADSPRISSDGG